MPHSQSVIAKIVRRLADRKVKPMSLRRFQPRRGQSSLHLFKQTVIIARDAAAADQIVIASRQQRRKRNGALEAFASLVETAKLGEQIAQQIMRHGVLRIARQCLSQYQFGFLIAILGQQRPRLAQSAEAAIPSRRRRAPETADCLVAMAQCVH